VILHEYEIVIPKRTKITILPCGDFHIGTKACNIDKLKELIAWIRRMPNIYIFGMGDYIDAINLSDKRFDPDMLTKKINIKRLMQDQTQECVDILMPIKHRIIGLGIGNHELAIAKNYHYDAMIEICGKLETKYLGWTSLTRMFIRRKGENFGNCSVVTIFAEHSLIGGKKKGNKINSLEDRSNDFEADIYLRGHSHEKIATTRNILGLRPRGSLKLYNRKRVYAICSSFYHAYEPDTMTYAEIGGYSPTSTGVIRIDIEIKHDGSKDYHIWQ